MASVKNKEASLFYYPFKTVPLGLKTYSQMRTNS
jgi:hypothetical protein